MDLVHIVGVLTVLTFVSFVVSIVTPGWLVMTYVFKPESVGNLTRDSYRTELHIGLWYTRACLKMEDLTPLCEMFSYGELSRANQLNSGMSLKLRSIIEAEVETTVGAFVVLLAGILICRYRSDYKYKILGKLAAFLLLLGDILFAIPTVRFMEACSQMMNFESLHRKVSLPYSVVIAALGIIFCIASFVILVIDMNRKRRGNTTNMSQKKDNQSQSFSKSDTSKKRNSDKLEYHKLKPTTTSKTHATA